MSHFNLAFITGASSGIGEALARLIAQKGINLFLLGRNQSKLDQLKDELSSKVHVDILSADLGKTEERQKVIHLIREQSPDLIINNAGLGFYGDSIERSTSEALEVLDVNVLALVEFTLEGARTLISQQRSGTILNVSSVAGCLPSFPGFAIYGASKAFVNYFTASVDEELYAQGIHVLAACPGVVDTHFQERAGSKKTEQNKDGNSKEPRMTAQFAAEEIWKQIENEQVIRIFNWKYRLSIFITLFIPHKWLRKLLKASIKSRR
jgi:uncharacterized protein